MRTRRTGQALTDHSAEVYAAAVRQVGMDAWGSQAAAFGNLWKATAEINESLFPHVQELRLPTDPRRLASGEGRAAATTARRSGSRRRSTPLRRRHEVPHAGHRGGGPGEPNRLVLRADLPTSFVTPPTGSRSRRVDIVQYDYGGGGGWGDPLERDPRAVLDDVLDEYVSLEGPSATTPVLRGSLEDLTLEIDQEATEKLRRVATPAATVGYRVGVDVGGTFTDLIAVTPEGEVVLDKTPTTLHDQSEGVMNGLAQLAERFGPLADLCAQVEILVHGTTTADNTMIQMDGAPTGLLVTEGHCDEIEMRRVHKEQIWDPAYRPPLPSPGAGRASPSRSGWTSGNVLLPLDEEAVRRGSSG